MKEQPLNTPAGAFKVFSIYFDQMKRHRFPIAGKTILNIGSGDLIGVDALLLLFGANRVISIDLNPGNYCYPHLFDQISFYETLWKILEKEAHISSSPPWSDILFSKNGRTFYNTDRLIRLCPTDVGHLPVKDCCIDFSFSNAVLEHVENPESTIKEIARTLTPGGHTMHRVDLRDHRDFSKPLEFLKPNKPSGGCNLWRSRQFKSAFERNGLKLADFTVFDACSVTEKERESFQPPFNLIPCNELSRLRFMVYASR